MAPEAPQQPPSPQVEQECVAVLIQVPADADYLPIIRSASAYVATNAGCTLPEVADLRLAVDEASSLLLRHSVRDRPAGGGPNPAPSLECRFRLDAAELRVMLSVPARDADRPQTDEFGWTILSALVDDIDWQADGGVVRVEIVKQRAATRE